MSKYVGIPFVSGGRDFAGCDCYGLVRLVLLEEFGCRLPVLAGDYDACRTAEVGPMFDTYAPLLRGERIGAPEAGAVAVIRVRGLPSHTGIFVNGGYMLHTVHKIGAHCTGIGSGFLRGGLEGIYRVDTAYRITASV
ncbi:MAG: C40 family peptidase [Treponema sp.]|nr:C40 family peptidase [Treponema sp.]